MIHAYLAPPTGIRWQVDPAEFAYAVSEALPGAVVGEPEEDGDGVEVEFDARLGGHLVQGKLVLSKIAGEYVAVSAPDPLTAAEVLTACRRWVAAGQPAIVFTEDASTPRPVAADASPAEMAAALVPG